MDPWLNPNELRVGLGCMRLSTDSDANQTRARETIAAALEAGITIFDTARAYGDNERLLAGVLKDAGASRARVVTKGGMARVDAAWVPDGRARSIRASCEASLVALDGLPIDLYLLHAPDPRTPWRTSVRALAKLLDERLVQRVGICNVNRTLLDEAVEHAPISAVQVGLSILDDTALRGGIVDRCSELGIALIAHSPLGGTRRAGTLARRNALADLARAHGATEAEVALAWVLSLGRNVVAVPGARRPETARSAARAAKLQLDREELARLGGSRPRPARGRRKGDVVVVMGIPGAGKSRIAERYVEQGYLRLNRDERGGSLRELSGALDEVLATGSRNVVLDNTYLTRARRSHVVEAAGRNGVSARCVWLDTPLAQAQVNLVERLLERFGAVPTPEELSALARHEPGVLPPTRQMRALRELEPPGEDEGFASVERVPYVRERREGRSGVFAAAAAVADLASAAADPASPHLVFDWNPAGSVADLAAAASTVAGLVSGPVETALCSHPGGPPICWCRPPLPGIPLAFARRHGIDPARSILVGASAAHRTLANALGARYVEARA